ncbi:hypothetical protein LCGC14_0912670 [marine sediment metagenome]|uniref:Uncharacterized protein n=1 Tax=marine sediment metagenome TaxID=412755 RepID=A0A0F9NXS1_9ZZZZ
MAKLAKLMNENIALKQRIGDCTEAYTELLSRYRKLYTKYSYQETMEQVKEVNEQRKKEGKILWENLKEKNPV